LPKKLNDPSVAVLIAAGGDGLGHAGVQERAG
jgi:hypothetical protein